MIRKSSVGIVAICLLVATVCCCLKVDGQKSDARQTKTVVIDAGHGGKDPGTIVGLAIEKNIVLDVALKLGKLIRQNQKNIKVVFTRDGDYFPTLMDRAQLANKIHADLFISIHANYCGSPEINGTETYVLGLHRTEDNLNVAKKENSVILLEDNYSKRYEGFNPNLSESYIMFELIQDTYLNQSLRFASILQSNFKGLAQRHDREVRQAGFLVLRETSMPSVLIETGYLSNKKENSYLLTENGRAEIAQSIYGSLVNYLSKIEAKDNVPVQSVKEVKDTNTQLEKVQIAKSKEKVQNEYVPSNDNKTTFAIQIGVFSKKIDPGSKIFKGISNIRVIFLSEKYKYICHESDSFQETKKYFEAVSKILPGAFIVSVKDKHTWMVGNGHGKK